MALLVDRVQRVVGRERFDKLWRYGSVSVISTILTNALLFTFYDVINLSTAMVCNVLATTITTVPAYYLNRTWTWRKTGKSDVWREVVPFWAISFASLVLSTVMVGIAAHNADHISNSKLVRSLLVVFANVFTYGSIWIIKFVLFNKYLFVKDAPAGDEAAAGGGTTGGLDSSEPAGAGIRLGVDGEVESPVHSGGDGFAPDLGVAASEVPSGSARSTGV